MRLNATNTFIAILATTTLLIAPFAQADECDENTLFRLYAYLAEIQQDQSDTIAALEETLGHLNQRVENVRPYLVQKGLRLGERQKTLIRQCKAGEARACTQARETEVLIQELRELITGGVLQGNVNRAKEHFISRARVRFANLSETAEGIIQRILSCR